MICTKKPGANKLIVKKVERKEVTDSGFILSDNEDSLLQKSQILAIGKCKDDTFIVGDYAYLARNAGVEIDHNEWLIREDEVLYCESN